MFIKRNESGKIVSCFPLLNEIENTYIPDNDPELISFQEDAKNQELISMGVTPVQARMALNAAGLRAAVEEYIASQSQDIKDTWEYSVKIHKSHPVVQGAAAALGLTEKQVDDLFLAAINL